MVTCLSQDQIARYVAGEGETVAIQQHVDSCETCRRGIATAIKADRATQLGRYIVIDKLGAGGMGVVYRAFDPELGRNVAVKMLHSGSADARLAREARALAALSHPNVVTIYDIGSDANGVFMAMELVDGATLRQWHTEQRTPAQIIDVLVQAGRGLAAAHAAGFVHRDFKPENVLVRTDGRAQVSDFGLARIDDEPEIASDLVGDSTGAILTKSGMVLGTLPYMAPEQVRGEVATARSDQFGYASVIVEMFARERPFRSDSLAERRAQFERGDSPTGVDEIPLRLRSAVRRALALDPSDRWPTLDPLLAAFGRSQRKKRRWPALGIAAAAIVSGGAVMLTTRHHTSCGHADERLAIVWNPARETAIGNAFGRSAKPFAQSSWQAARTGLDAYTHDWSTAIVGVCEDTHVRNNQSEAMLDLRTACLDQRLAAVDALATVFEQADDSTVENAAKAVQQLPQLAACNDKDALAQTVPPPTDPVTRSRVDALRTRLAAAQALRTTGQVAQAVTVADAVTTDALVLDYPPASAEALLLKGTLEADRHVATAEATLAHAADLAEAGRADATKAEAWMQLVRAATATAHYADAHAHAQHAAAVLQRLGPGHEALVARLANYEGSTYMEEGDYAHALELQQRALALREKLYNGDGPEVATSLNSLGNVQFNLSHDKDALAAHTRALEIRTRVLGPHHPDTAGSHGNLAAALESMGKLDQALDHQKQALAIDIEVFGPQSKQTMQATGNIAHVYKSMGRYEDAVEWAKKAIVLAEATVGPEHPITASQHYVLGESYLELADLPHAGPEIQRSLELRKKIFGPEHADVLASERLLGRYELQAGHLEKARDVVSDVLAHQLKTLGPDHSDVAGSEGMLGYISLNLRDFKAADNYFEAALANDEKNLGKEHGDLVLDLVGIGNARLLAHDAKAAVAPLERAMVLVRKLADVEPGARGDAMIALAKARWDSGGDHAGAIALATEAKTVFTERGAAKTGELAAANAWLATHKK